MMLVFEFIKKMLTDQKINAIATRHNFTPLEFAGLYAGVIHLMMPTPWMNAGGPMIAATAFFMEPHRLESVLAEAEREGCSLSGDDRLNFVIEKMTEAAKTLKDSHDLSFGPANVDRYVNAGRPGSGCLGAIMLPLLISSFLFLVLITVWANY
jgi:hypothetical protein